MKNIFGVLLLIVATAVSAICAMALSGQLAISSAGLMLTVAGFVHVLYVNRLGRFTVPTKILLILFLFPLYFAVSNLLLVFDLMA